MLTEEQKQETRERIGQRIAALRKLTGKSQVELAEHAGIQRPHLTRIEQGKYSVQLDILQSIASEFGMVVDIVDPRMQGLAPLKPL